MLGRQVKATFYAVAGPVMRLNALVYRGLRAPRGDGVRVHLGPGQKNYLDGWINVDANMFTAKCDVWADLRYPLPFRDGSVEAVYSHHVVEHLPDLGRHFADVFRCLKPGGLYRVAGPNGDSAIRKFLANEHAWFGDFPDKRVSIGGRLDNFIFCRREHLAILTYSYVEEVMAACGFTDFARCLPVQETRTPEVFGPCLTKERENDFATPHTLIVEARKPL